MSINQGKIEVFYELFSIIHSIYTETYRYWFKFVINVEVFRDTYIKGKVPCDCKVLLVYHVAPFGNNSNATASTIWDLHYSHQLLLNWIQCIQAWFVNNKRRDDEKILTEARESEHQMRNDFVSCKLLTSWYFLSYKIRILTGYLVFLLANKAFKTVIIDLSMRKLVFW